MQPREKEIDGLTFVVKPLGFQDGRAALVRLQRIVGPSLGELLGGGTKGGIARALTELSSRVSEPELTWFCDKFGARTLVHIPDESDSTGFRVLKPEGKDALDELFAGRYLRMFAWLEFCLEVNFGDFLGRLEALVAKALPKVPEALSRSKSPQDSTGKSGESSPTSDLE